MTADAHRGAHLVHFGALALGAAVNGVMTEQRQRRLRTQILVGEDLPEIGRGLIASMSENSRPGCTPCAYMLSARLTMSTFPVRSPLPKRQPSTRSMPAIIANSAAAVPVPRSLCGWTDSTIESRFARLRCIHSI